MGPRQPGSICWVSQASLPPLRLSSSLRLTSVAANGTATRGPHYKQQIKGLPLIRCQGQRGALPVLAMIQYLLICCAPA